MSDPLDYEIDLSNNDFLEDSQLHKQQAYNTFPQKGGGKIEIKIQANNKRMTDRSNMYLHLNISNPDGTSYAAFRSGLDFFGNCSVKDNNSVKFDNVENVGLANRISSLLNHTANYRNNHLQVQGRWPRSDITKLNRGTVTIANADADMTGTGTFFTEDYKVGDVIAYDTKTGTIATIVSNTALTLSANNAGDSTGKGHANLTLGQTSADAGTFFDLFNSSTGVDLVIPLSEFFNFMVEDKPYLPLNNGLEFELMLNTNNAACFFSDPTKLTAFEWQVNSAAVYYETYELLPALHANFDSMWKTDGIPIKYLGISVDSGHKIPVSNTTLSNTLFARTFANLESWVITRRLSQQINSPYFYEYEFRGDNFGTFQTKYKTEFYPKEAIDNVPVLYNELQRNMGVLGETFRDNIGYLEYDPRYGNKTADKQIIFHSWNKSAELENSGISTYDGQTPELHFTLASAATLETIVDVVALHTVTLLMSPNESMKRNI